MIYYNDSLTIGDHEYIAKNQKISCLKKQISLSTKTEIKASPNRIWKTIVDVRNYRYWNPFIQYSDGDLRT
ncbi:hypothetical protein BH18THE2_BH18THE2_27150 [soil metagenome]